MRTCCHLLKPSLLLLCASALLRSQSLLSSSELPLQLLPFLCTLGLLHAAWLQLSSSSSLYLMQHESAKTAETAPDTRQATSRGDMAILYRPQ